MGKETASVVAGTSWEQPTRVRDQFVGREQELTDLWERLNRALGGRGQVAFVVGQAGSGKTALVFHFLRRAYAIDSDFAVAVGGCNAQTGIGDPYLPFREALLMLTSGKTTHRVAGLFDSDEPKTARTVLVRSAQVLVEVAPDLVGLFVPGASLAGAVGKAVADKMGWMDKLDESVKPGAAAAPDQARVFEQYTAYILSLSERMPVLLFVDDLQWADSASLGLFFHLARRIVRHRVILVGAYRASDVALGRDGRRHPLEPIVRELTRYYGDITIDLDHIPDIVSRHFIDALVDAEPNHLDRVFRDALYTHTQGHALFTVELLDMMRRRGTLLQDESGTWEVSGEIDWRAVPPRVDGIIGERIGRLDDQLREMLTIASVEGESFTAEVIARVQALSEREAVQQLSRELGSEHRLVGPQGTVTVGTRRLSLYRFLHSLFQQYLYEQLTQAERAYLHEDVGRVLAILFEGQTQDIAAQLARHFELAALWEEAAGYRLQAANRALRLSGHPEAISHAERGLSLLRKDGASSAQDEVRLGLQIALAVASISSNGYNCPQARRAFDEARLLAREIGKVEQELAALYGLSLVGLLRGELSDAQQLGAELAARAKDVGSQTYALGGELIRSAAEMFLGHFEEARRGLERVLATYDRDRHGNLATELTWDPGVAARSFLALILWHQGYLDQAVSMAQAAIDEAHSLNHPFSVGQALSFSATLHHLLRDRDIALIYAEQASAVGQEGSYYAWEAMGGVARGLALAYRSPGSQGIQIIEESLRIWDDAGARLTTDYYEANLAEAYLLAGDPEAGLTALDVAAGPTEASWWEAERQRLRARLILKTQDSRREAEALLRGALSHAREIGSRTLELRAAIDLTRLLEGTPRHAEALRTLTEIRKSFREGHKTVDLREATELLSGSAASAPLATQS